MTRRPNSACPVGRTGLLVVVWLTAAASLRGQDELQTRQARIQAMSTTDKQELLAKKERFDQLSPAEQVRLRRLHEALTQDRQANQLQQVLQSYTTWLATLPAKDRAELRDLRDPAERLARIRELKARNEDKQLAQYHLSTTDAKRVLEWFDKTLETHQEEMMARVRRNGPPPPTDPGRDRIQQRFVLIGQFMRHTDEILAIIPPDEIQQLLSSLSDEANEHFAELNATDKQRKLLGDWIRVAAQYKFRPQPMSDAELDRMIASLPDEDRKQLELLPREKIYEELRKRMEMTRGFGPRRGRNDRDRNDGRRGDGRPNGFRDRPEFPPGPPPDGPGGPDRRRDDERRDDDDRRGPWDDDQRRPPRRDRPQRPAEPAPALAEPAPEVAPTLEVEPAPAAETVPVPSAPPTPLDPSASQ